MIRNWLNVLAVLATMVAPAFASSDKLPYQDPPNVTDAEYVIYGVRIPNTGTLEVTVKPTKWTTKLIMQFEEFPDLQTIDSGSTGGSRTFNITKQQQIYFNLVNNPDNGNAFWTAAYNPSARFENNVQGWQTDAWDFSVAGAGGSIVTFRYKYVPAAAPAPQLVACSGIQQYSGAPGFDRGFCATAYCGNSPESWVRGRADIDRASGRVAMELELETDSVAAGPKGSMDVALHDANGAVLKSIKSAVSGIGGKTPGKSWIVDIPATINVDQQIANKVSSVAVSAMCNGAVDKWFNLIPGNLKLSVTFDIP
jgi:hypothetical protein